MSLGGLFPDRCSNARQTVQERAQAALKELRHRGTAAFRAEALSETLSAFPSWFLRIECDRCGKVRMLVDRAIINTFSGETGDEITHSWCHPSRRIGLWLGGDSRVRSGLMHRVDGGFENRKALLQ